MTLSRTHRPHPKPRAAHSIRYDVVMTLAAEHKPFTQAETMARWGIGRHTFDRVRQMLGDHVVAVSMPGCEIVYEFRSR